MEAPESSVTGDIAVDLVGLIVGKQLGWIVRPQLRADKGIDAQLEAVQDSKATGRLVALQVKGGESRFSEPTADGFVFRPKAKHVAYWLGHSLPDRRLSRSQHPIGTHARFVGPMVMSALSCVHGLVVLGRAFGLECWTDRASAIQCEHGLGDAEVDVVGFATQEGLWAEFQWVGVS